jgi:hypothetical protein
MIVAVKQHLKENTEPGRNEMKVAEQEERAAEWDQSEVRGNPRGFRKH